MASESEQPELHHHETATKPGSTVDQQEKKDAGWSCRETPGRRDVDVDWLGWYGGLKCCGKLIVVMVDLGRQNIMCYCEGAE
jgi:hypothetical protein